ncbi:MAG: pyridoxal-phosphate dependent enzyme, partial [Planctomycetes bacterium]|nr:pyridoxal-phosphate dependent enzyme [Planctomycetota bacterium]
MKEILSAIGNTPLVELQLGQPAGVRLFAKLESVNPGGSLKDRPVRRILKDALARGDLSGGRRLIDSSSGNAGIAYAMLGATLGVPVTLVVPGNASQERLDRIRSHGAELIVTDPMNGYDFAIEEARRLSSQHPDRYWYANQYGNESNWRAHYEETGGEILEQLTKAGAGVLDLFVGGVGTGGSITGIGRRVKKANATARVVSVIPDIFPGIEGLKPLGHAKDIVPEILDETIIDERVDARIEDAI